VSSRYISIYGATERREALGDESQAMKRLGEAMAAELR
jgi:hypothetical protein